ncbi:unnamed protein product [Acanthoscelides obtectus]|uniref:Uncharacterized protein n=1 Tax=Acanthoscelides obtectus TaxID=200917 RepID=A0A9P0LZK2_ACAOB|nr:unnamed protein product [Acanthoscelides obtectus]CAK1683784.1 hypothetical protein AOBTE_LOCUS34453 [Acanthoscelides obtectus]
MARTWARLGGFHRKTQLLGGCCSNCSRKTKQLSNLLKTSLLEHPNGTQRIYLMRLNNHKNMQHLKIWSTKHQVNLRNPLS